MNCLTLTTFVVVKKIYLVGSGDGGLRTSQTAAPVVSFFSIVDELRGPTRAVVATFPQSDVIGSGCGKSVNVMHTAPHSLEDPDATTAVVTTTVVPSAGVQRITIVPTPSLTSRKVRSLLGGRRPHRCAASADS